MKTPSRQTIYIYDHPESKIQFLEQSLAGKDWRAKLVYPDDTPERKAHITEARDAFEQRGYLVREFINEHNQHVLEIHHTGEGSKPSEVIQEMGLAKGAGRLISNPSIPLEATLAKGQAALTSLWKTAKDPAHLNGIIYMVAEAFLMWPESKKAAQAKATTAAVQGLPKNMWRKIGFGFFFAQSFTYLFGAKNNDATSFDEFKNKINRNIKDGDDLTEIHYDETTDKPSDSIGQNMLRLLRRYPIEAGALFNNLGMALYIGGAMLDRHHYKIEIARNPNSEIAKKGMEYLQKGTGLFGLKNGGAFYHDMRGALTSIAAWTLMLVPGKKKEDATEQPGSKNIFARAWDAARENPQVGTGFLTLASSYQRLHGALGREKIDAGSARNQIRGEKVYIGGDIMLMFTKNDHYGKKTGNVDTLAETLSDYINKMPLLLGQESQHKMVKNMADFLLKKGLEEIKRNPHTASFTAEELKERADMLIVEVGRRVRNSYAEQMEQLGDISARLVAQFPDNQRSALIDKLAEAMPNLPWMYATTPEIKAVIEAAVKRCPDCKPSNQLAPEKEIRQSVATLVGIMPEGDMGGSAAVIYDAIAPIMATTKLPDAPKPTVTHITRDANVKTAPTIAQAIPA